MSAVLYQRNLRAPYSWHGWLVYTYFNEKRGARHATSFAIKQFRGDFISPESQNFLPCIPKTPATGENRATGNKAVRCTLSLFSREILSSWSHSFVALRLEIPL